MEGKEEQHLDPKTNGGNGEDQDEEEEGTDTDDTEEDGQD